MLKFEASAWRSGNYVIVKRPKDGSYTYRLSIYAERNVYEELFCIGYYLTLQEAEKAAEMHADSVPKV